MTAGRLDDRGAGKLDNSPEILYLADPIRKIILVEHFLQSGRHRVDITSRHSPVRRKAFDYYHQFDNSLLQFFIVESDKAAHIGQTVLLGRHQRPIDIREHLLSDFLDTLFFESGFVAFDKVRIFGKTSAVEEK